MNDSGFDSFITKLSLGDYPHHEGNTPLSLSMVVFDRFMVEEQFGWRVRSAAPNVLRVIDTQDLASLRHCRKQSLSPDTPADSESLPSSSSPDSHTISPSDDFPLSLEDPVVLRELAALHRADASLVVSQVEAQLCTRMGLAAHWQRDANGQEEHVSGDGLPLLPSLPKIWYVPITFPTPSAAASAAPMRSFDDRKDFVFIGTWRHAPNVDTVEYLKYTIYPLIREKFRNIGIPECNIPELHIYGTYATSAHTALHDPSNGFKVMGTASSVERVMPLYKLLLAPIRFGAGVKGKLLDAFRSGTPVVASSVAAEDVWLRPLPLGASDPSLVDWAVETQPPFGGVVSDDAEAFAQHVVELYFDESRWSAAADIAVKTISARYTDDIAVECLRDMLTTIGYSDAPAPASSSQPHVASQSPLLPDTAKVARLRGRDYTGQVLWQQQLRSTQFMGQMMEQKQRTRMDAQKSVKNQQ
jgi:glycosyltransferase involved in cell wall biosynthesis